MYKLIYYMVALCCMPTTVNYCKGCYIVAINVIYYY